MDAWDIEVDKVSEERLSNIDLRSLQQRGKDRPPIEDGSHGDDTRVLCRENGSCTFLREDKLCALHATHGLKQKPQTCIDFPFRFIDTPGGPYVGLSFACTAVLQNHGRPVEDQRDEISRNYPESVHVREHHRNPSLTGRIDMTFEAYLAVERAMDEILSIPGTPLSRRLLAQSMLLDVIVEAFETIRFSREKKLNLSEEEQIAANSAADLEIVEGLTNRYRADGWGRLLAAGVRLRPFPPLHRAFIGLVTTFRRMLWRERSRWSAALMAGRFYAAHTAKLGRIHLPPLEKPISYRELRKFWPDERNKEYDSLLTRYFRHVLFRKDLLVAETLRTGHRLMLMNAALINWYIAGETARHHPDRPDIDCLHEGLRDVEQAYVLHSTYASLLENQPVLGSMIDQILRGPAYPATILSPPVT